MCSHVRLQMGLLIKTLAALRTDKHAFPSVSLYVSFNVLLPGEGFATRRAREGPLSCMDPNVGLQMDPL